MMLFRRVKVRSFEKALLFRNREFAGLLGQGKYTILGTARRMELQVVSMREPWLVHPDLDLIVRSGKLGDEAKVIDLTSNQRALVWIDGRFDCILGPGLYALWTTFAKVKVEIVDATGVRFQHASLATILASGNAAEQLEEQLVPEGMVGLFYRDGVLVELLEPGRYAFFRKQDKYRLFLVDRRESVLDVAGQEIMTADKVTLRMNAVVTFQVVDPYKAVSAVSDFTQALYRESQLALRAVVGTRELDQLLADKDALTLDLERLIVDRATQFGLKVVSVGIRDIVLPGDMKDLLNRVTEAKKAAEAALISRREETAAMRSQANTAKLLDNNPTLMRLRELEVLEKIAEKSKLTVVLGEKGLTDRMVNLL